MANACPHFWLWHFLKRRGDCAGEECTCEMGIEAFFTSPGAMDRGFYLNDVSTLPKGVFDGLTNLEDL